MTSMQKKTNHRYYYSKKAKFKNTKLYHNKLYKNVI